MSLPVHLRMFSFPVMGYGKQIRKYRTQAGLTLAELSQLADVDIGTISALEQRDSSRSQYFPQLAAALGLAFEQFVNPDFEGRIVATRHPQTGRVLRVRLAGPPTAAREDDAGPASQPVLDEAYEQLLADLEDLPPPRRSVFLEQIHKAADEAREAAAHFEARRRKEEKVSATEATKDDGMTVTERAQVEQLRRETIGNSSKRVIG